jgi:hypothetical protein
MGRSELIEVAWFEYKVTRQVSTGNGEMYLAQWRVPGVFVAKELGYGGGQGPSLEENLRRLPATNRRNRRVFAILDRQPKKKLTKKKRERQMRAVVKARRAMAA